MPVDHPAASPAVARPTYFRTISLALGFLLTLGLLLATAPVFNLSAYLS